MKKRWRINSSFTVVVVDNDSMLNKKYAEDLAFFFMQINFLFRMNTPGNDFENKIQIPGNRKKNKKRRSFVIVQDLFLSILYVNIYIIFSIKQKY